MHQLKCIPLLTLRISESYIKIKFNGNFYVHTYCGASKGFMKALKVVSATFLLLSLNESTRQTRKNIFHFTSKALSDLKKIKF